MAKEPTLKRAVRTNTGKTEVAMLFMLVEEVLDPNLADNQERCYSRVATPIRSFARYKVDCAEENKLDLSIGSFFHKSGDFRTMTDCT